MIIKRYQFAFLFHFLILMVMTRYHSLKKDMVRLEILFDRCISCCFSLFFKRYATLSNYSSIFIHEIVNFNNIQPFINEKMDALLLFLFQLFFLTFFNKNKNKLENVIENCNVSKHS
jgi:hypothetical protein